MTTGVDSEKFHPQYRELHAELLARPFPMVSGQVIVSHRVIHFLPGEEESHRAGVAALAGREDVAATPEEQGFQLLRWNGAEVRIERHKEFTTFTVFAPQTGAPFSGSAIDLLPEDWLDGIPGRILAAVEIASELVASSDAGTTKTMERVLETFGQEQVVGGWVVERVASVWSHFRPDDRGATRFLIQIHRLTSGRYGRLLQRLVEIETYRMAAMLSLPLARELLPQIEKLEVQHAGLLERADGDGQSLLENLTNISLATGRLQSHCGSRFGLTESYASILSARVKELHEEPVPGYQTLSEFFDQRLVHSWHTCERAEAGLNALSERLQSTTGSLRARAEIGIQNPNHQLPATADHETVAPLRLQRRLEILLVVILTYYFAGFLKIGLDGVMAFGLRFNSSLVVTLLLPVLAYGVWKLVKFAGPRD
ncbi:MAG: DUF3422 domain-containing protein [Luteolibacter sp.]